MFEIRNMTKTRPPINRRSISEIKNRVLGKQYELSVVFIGKDRARNLNKKFRGKNKPANVLSFPLEKYSSRKKTGVGEIFINLDTKIDANKFEISYKNFLELLLVHGALHLKGMDHGTAMERAENKYLREIRNSKRATRSKARF